MKILYNLENYINNNGNEKALVYGDNEQVLTYKELWEISGRVYSYLKSHNIGFESIVIINMNRGVMPYCALLGVLRAGAAFILSGDNVATERYVQMKEALDNYFEINDEVFKEILKNDILTGYEIPSSHNMAFIIFTSGSTGRPKGIIHEYGKLDIMLNTSNYQGESFVIKGKTFATTATFGFLISVHGFFMTLSEGACFIIPQKEIAANPNALMNYYEKMQVSSAFFLPSYYKLIEKLPNCLENIILGGEMASYIDSHSKNVICCYAMSESGFVVFSAPSSNEKYQPLKPSDNSIDFIIKDDELCFKNEFTRGYVNKDIEYIVDEEGYFHTGDIASYVNCDSITIKGRRDDMFKILGHRIEPAEIEFQLKRVLKLKELCVIPYEAVESKAIAVFYTDNVLADIKSIKESLLEYLPEYMIPSLFIKIESLPLLPNGKVNKVALKSMIKHQENFSIFTIDEIEKRLCEIYSNVLGITDVSGNTDFYEEGGDSLKANQVIYQFNHSSFSLLDLIRYKTVKAVAKVIFDKMKAEKDDDSLRPLNYLYPLTDMQNAFFADDEIIPTHTINVLAFNVVFKDADTDAVAIKAAIESVFEKHAALRTRIVYSDSRRFQYISDKKITADIIECEEVEVSNIIDSIKFESVIDCPLFISRIFKTPQKVYLYIQSHHIIFDGKSVQVILHDLSKALAGNEIKDDNYIVFLNYLSSDKYKQHIINTREYFSSLYYQKDFGGIPHPDIDTDNYVENTICVSLENKDNHINNYLASLNCPKTSLFVLAAFFTLSKYNNTDKNLVSFTYSQRFSIDLQNMVGPLISDLPIGLENCNAFMANKPAALKLVSDKLNEAYLNSTLSCSDGVIFKNNEIIADCDDYPLEEYMMNIIYQEGIFEDYNTSLNADIEYVTRRDTMSDTAFSLEIIEENGRFDLYFSYMECLYYKESVNKFIEMYIDEINNILKPE